MLKGVGFVLLNVSSFGALDREREREGDLCLMTLKVTLASVHLSDVLQELNSLFQGLWF